MRPIWIDNLIQPASSWQTRLIHHNLLAIGHSAWEGYLNSGAGLVVCQLEAAPESADWAVDCLPALSFVPASQAADLPIAPAAIIELLAALDSYEPAQAIILLCSYGAREAELSLLQDLAISPPDCYQQMRRRWGEFVL